MHILLKHNHIIKIQQIIESYLSADQQQQKMGFEVQDYPIILKTGISGKYSSINCLMQSTNICIETQKDIIMCPIFTDEYLFSLAQSYQNTSQQHFGKKKISLDHSLIPSDIRYKKKAYTLFHPEINQCIWQQQFPDILRNSLIEITVGYCSFLNIRNFMIRLPFRGNQQLENKSKMSIIIQSFKSVKKSIIKSYSRVNFILQLDGSSEEEGNTQKNQIIWNQYINFLKQLEQIFEDLSFELNLHFRANLPSPFIVNRWKSEKVSNIIFDSSCFIENSKGFKALPARHQRIFLQFANIRAGIILNFEKISEESEDYFKFLCYSFRKKTQNTLRSDRDALNLIDYLQNPLQPYADNLQSQTYQIFENDQIKYDQYQGALEEAFEKFPKNHKITIYYIGAGRGGLLFNAFAAANKKQKKIHVYAVQKNPYPIQTIKDRLIENRWKQHVTIIESDIRDYHMQQKPDIFLSELLGGFGDNQLSPECLYWAEKNITENTICIPQSYTSYIKPISCQGIHRTLTKQNRNCYYTVNYGSYYTHFQSKPVWEFKHPLTKGPEQFNRDSQRIQFEAKSNIIINGFAGYFTTHLYGRAQLSILPQNPTFGSYSWFPLLFPFEQSVYLKKGQSIQINMSRRHVDKKVWYEWQYRVGQYQSIVHNRNGWKIIIQL